MAGPGAVLSQAQPFRSSLQLHQTHRRWAVDLEVKKRLPSLTQGLTQPLADLSDRQLTRD